MKKLLIALGMLAGCQAEPEQTGNAVAGAGGGKGTSVAPPNGSAASITTLAGLYEGQGKAGRTSQLCMVDPEGETARFGLVVWGEGNHSCSGSGTAVRNAGTLRLKMAGDEACTIDARIEGNAVVLPDRAPESCAYYCGAKAQLGSARLTQAGTGPAEAAKAKDLVGDPLC